MIRAAAEALLMVAVLVMIVYALLCSIPSNYRPQPDAVEVPADG